VVGHLQGAAWRVVGIMVAEDAQRRLIGERTAPGVVQAWSCENRAHVDFGKPTGDGGFFDVLSVNF
jgi:hypothetical protein